MRFARAARSVAALSCSIGLSAQANPALRDGGRSEPCASRAPLRRAFFGDTHVHTAFSFDASALGVRNTPRDAYRFAQGEGLGIQPYDAEGRALRSARLARPLDFAVVTDHSELLGEVRICSTPGMPGYDSLVCTLTRRWPLLAYYIVNSAIFNIRGPQRYSFCGPHGERCRDAAMAPWQEIQRAAEEAYDRTSSCRFTSFVGYEWSPNPDSNMIHRNVIFRGRAVQRVPSNYLDVPSAEGLWRDLSEQCLERGDGCDVLAIAHNANLSGGQLFRVEGDDGRAIDAAQARRRARLERLLEVIQHKGASECRVRGFSEDELCAFELLPFATMDQHAVKALWSRPPSSSYAREALADGMLQQQRIAVNPFKFGLLGSSDTHLGTPGLVSESGFPGHAAGGDTSRLEIPLRPDRLFFNPGGLAVVWAEENSRDAIFEAMRRRETYGTSGPRMVLRLFGGWRYPADLCDEGDFVARGYRDGVPMGGDLPAREGDASPTLAVWVLRDAGAAGEPGGKLQRVQIIKLWVEDGAARERVHEMLGDPANGATVDAKSCRPEGPGLDSLCGVWRDPDFDPAVPALYYARVLENPSCRWSARVCLTNGVDCAQPKGVPSELAYCCEDDVPRVIQERAWSSPIWYTPSGTEAVSQTLR